MARLELISLIAECEPQRQRMRIVWEPKVIFGEHSSFISKK